MPRQVLPGHVRHLARHLQVSLLVVALLHLPLCHEAAIKIVSRGYCAIYSLYNQQGCSLLLLMSNYPCCPFREGLDDSSVFLLQRILR